MGKLVRRSRCEEEVLALSGLEFVYVCVWRGGGSAYEERIWVS